MNKTQTLAWMVCACMAACTTRDETRNDTSQTASAPSPAPGPGPSPTPNPNKPSPASAPGPSEPVGLSHLEASLGKEISLRVSPVEIPHQHMIDPVPGKSVEYVQLPAGSQIVVYAKGAKACPGDILLTGKVIEVAGAGKGPGGGTHRELQLDASSWECASAP